MSEWINEWGYSFQLILKDKEDILWQNAHNSKR